MTMGLQDLMMFRDNLQQPQPTGMDNLRSLQALTMQGMANEDYMNQTNPMMNAGLMSLTVAQAGFGGFIKSITKGISGAVKGVAKGVTGAVKGIAKGVKNIAGSPIGQFALPLAAMYLGPAAFGLPATLGGKVALASGATGLTSLVGGAKPSEALKRAAIAGALTYGGGKLFGGGGASGKTASGALTPDKTGFAGTAPTTGSYSQVGLDQIAGGGLQPQYAVGGIAPDIGSATYGSQITNQLATNPMTGINTASAPQMANYSGDIGAAQYPGGGATASTSTPIIQDQVITPRTPIQRIKDSLPFSGTDEAGTLLTREVPGLDKVAGLIPESNLGKAALGVAGLSLLGGEQQIPQDQLAIAGLTPVETDFDKQVFTYKDREGNILRRDEALALIQQASQNVGAGGQQMASGVRYGFERKAQSGGMVDPVLSASGGLIGMAYGGQMPQNNMDVKYKEFSGMVGGEGTGMEDNVYMPIVEGEQGQQIATLAVSPKEYVVDANTMSLLGNGNPDEGAEVMDQTVKDIRKKATGQTQQQKEIDGLAALNRMRRSI